MENRNWRVGTTELLLFSQHTSLPGKGFSSLVNLGTIASMWSIADGQLRTQPPGFLENLIVESMFADQACGLLLFSS
jgi:hypothetical protein